MSKFTDKVRGIFRRRRPVTPEEAHDLADWVNEGGAFDPDGPPSVAEQKKKGDERRS